MAKWIKASGETTEVAPASKKKNPKFTLDELQGFVGGYIEAVYLPHREVMFCNEEGKLRGLPLNREATAIALQLGLAQNIMGDVIVCKRGEA